MLLALGTLILGWHLCLGMKRPNGYLTPGTITRAHWAALLALACAVFGTILQVRALQQMPRPKALLKWSLVLLLILESLSVLSGRGVWTLPGLDPRVLCVALAVAAMLL